MSEVSDQFQEIKQCARRIQELTENINRLGGQSWAPRVPSEIPTQVSEALSDDQAAQDLSLEFYNFAGVTTVTNDPEKEREIWLAVARKARQILAKGPS